jgi:ElaA protein
MGPEWKCRKFEELTPYELYAILQLRSEVFVVEQNCPFLDADNKDLYCYHLCGWTEGSLAAYSRLVPPALAFKEMSIGRVVTSQKYRSSGYGRKLMQESISTCYRLFGKDPIRIGAQLYLKHFYESLGFRQDGAIYDEDGIDHIHMILN